MFCKRGAARRAGWVSGSSQRADAWCGWREGAEMGYSDSEKPVQAERI